MQASANASGSIRATAVLNGGGAPLKLKTTSGRIRLKFLDSDVALHQMLVSEQVDRLNRRLAENGFVPAPFSLGAEPTTPVLADVPPSPDTKTDWLEAWLDRFERVLRGGISENPDDFQRRLVNSPKPSYPALSQRAGLQRFLKLPVRAKEDGSGEVQKLPVGQPALPDA